MGFFSWVFPDRRSFDERLLDGLERHSSVCEIESVDEDHLKVHLRDGRVLDSYLGTLREEFNALPLRDRSEFLARVLSLYSSVDLSCCLSEVSEDILPVIKAEGFGWTALLASEPPPPPECSREILPVLPDLTEGLEVYLVHDTPQSMAYLTAARLAEAELAPESALETALANLRARTPHPPEEIGPELFASGYGDCFDAARALLPEWIAQAPVTGLPLVALPDRCNLLIGSHCTADFLLDEAERLFHLSQRPLTPRLYVCEEGRLRPWEVPRRHPLAPMVARSRILERSLLYEEQKHLLERFHRSQGREELFVADVLVVGEDHALQSLSAWSEGIETLLPETDLIGFGCEGPECPLDPGEIFPCPWSDVLEVAGHLLEPYLDLRPRRWRTRGFPDRETLDRLRRAAECSPSCQAR